MPPLYNMGVAYPGAEYVMWELCDNIWHAFWEAIYDFM